MSLSKIMFFFHFFFFLSSSLSSSFFCICFWLSLFSYFYYRYNFIHLSNSWHRATASLLVENQELTEESETHRETSKWVDSQTVDRQKKAEMDLWKWWRWMSLLHYNLYSVKSLCASLLRYLASGQMWLELTIRFFVFNIAAHHLILRHKTRYVNVSMC